MPGRGTIAMFGGLPAARRDRMTGRKSRAVSYWVLIPVSAVNLASTLSKASFSLPPHSESTETVPPPPPPLA